MRDDRSLTLLAALCAAFLLLASLRTTVAAPSLIGE